jgi:hypothetical protein
MQFACNHAPRIFPSGAGAETRRQVAWETNIPKGAKFHVAWFAKDGLHVLDIWDSQTDFEKFINDGLMPRSNASASKANRKFNLNRHMRSSRRM